MIKAVIFDCFGVLTSDGWLPLKKKYFGHDAALLQEATDMNKQTDAGLISYHDFVVGIAELAHISPEEVSHEIETNTADNELFEYIKTLKPHYKIGMLSNAPKNWLHEMFSDEQVRLFDAVALSFETGFIKPQPESYEAIAERLGVSLEECLFIDDQERYCTAAQDIGMQAIAFHSTEQAIADIASILK